MEGWMDGWEAAAARAAQGAEKRQRGEKKEKGGLEVWRPLLSKLTARLESLQCCSVCIHLHRSPMPVYLLRCVCLLSACVELEAVIATALFRTAKFGGIVPGTIKKNTVKYNDLKRKKCDTVDGWMKCNSLKSVEH